MIYPQHTFLCCGYIYITPAKGAVKIVWSVLIIIGGTEGIDMRVSHLNFNHLYYFWHVCKEGSVVGAAEALYLTPQTITGQIKALEERLGGKLFKRQGRGLVPSELGQLIFATLTKCLC